MAPRRDQSINDILRAHCRERLFVAPVAWTDSHLQVLSCRFVAPGRCASPLRSPRPPTPPHPPPRDPWAPFEPPTVSEWAQCLSRRRDIWWKRDAITALVAYFEGSPFDRVDAVWFRFAGRQASRIPCYLYDLRPTGERVERTPSGPDGSAEREGDGAPCIAYLELSELGVLRKKKLEPPIDRKFRDNMPVFRISKRKVRCLTPADPLNDAYFAGLLIALAQKRRRKDCKQGRERSPEGGDGDATKVVLISTDWKDSDCLYLYSAAVSAAFFRKLDQPNDPAPEASLDIEREPLPFRPYDTLRERLVAALLEKLGEPGLAGSQPAVMSGEMVSSELGQWPQADPEAAHEPAVETAEPAKPDVEGSACVEEPGEFGRAGPNGSFAVSIEVMGC